MKKECQIYTGGREVAKEFVNNLVQKDGFSLLKIISFMMNDSAVSKKYSRDDAEYSSSLFFEEKHGWGQIIWKTNQDHYLIVKWRNENIKIETDFLNSSYFVPTIEETWEETIQELKEEEPEKDNKNTNDEVNKAINDIFDV